MVFLQEFRVDDYQQTIRMLSDRIVLAQTPIRVLDAVKWDDGIRNGFLKAKGKEMPAVDRDYYLNRPLAFDSNKVKLEFQNIERDITRQLGQFNPVGQIMRRMCKEYRMVVRMLEARGTCLLYTSPSPRDLSTSRMPSSA